MPAMRKHSYRNFYHAVIDIVKKIPRGRVATYGQIAALAGNPRAARQIAWVLHTASKKHRLPWHRVINRLGGISLPRYGGYELQRELLTREKVRFEKNDRINLAHYQWRPAQNKR